MSMSRGTATPRRRLFIGAAVLALIVALIAVGLVLGTRSTEAPASPDRSAATDEPAASDASKCGLESDGTDSLPQAPSTTWSTDTPIAAPSSPEAGPGETTDGIHSCFARTPTGALFAAANLATDSSNPAIDPIDILEQRVVRDENFEELREETEGNTSPGNERGMQLAGFRLNAYTPDAATVELVARTDAAVDGGALIALTYNVRWQDGDWMLVVPQNQRPPASQLVSLAGYVEWSAA